MKVRRSIVLGVLSAAALTASATAVYAGPCASEIDRMVARINVKLGTVARTEPSAPESVEARQHRQPTPGSIAAAESQRGGLSVATVEAVKAAMTRAREADGVGDQSACDQALGEVQRLIGP